MSDSPAATARSASGATYWRRWGLRNAPFHAAANSEGYYLSSTHEEALARLHFLAEHRRRLGVLLGERGSGKTLLLSRFAGELRREGILVAVAGMYGAGARELLSGIAAAWGLGSHRDEPLHVLWSRLSDRLAECRYQRLPAVLLLDDADRAANDALTTAVRLLQADVSSEASLTAVMSAQRRGAGRLGSRLLEMAELRIDLDPWTAEETTQYVQTSLVRAGRSEPLFEEDALKRLHELAGGTPRRIAHLADLALVAAAEHDLPTIGPATIEAVHRELIFAPANFRRLPPRYSPAARGLRDQP